MKSFPGNQSGERRARRLAIALCACVVLAMGAAASSAAWGQAVESATAPRSKFWGGGGGSYYSLQYGGRKMLGITAWVDYDTVRKIGVEGEGRWLEYHQTANVHAETYLGGLRYHFNYGRMQIYGKGLVGLGEFNFPYNYGTGSYLVVAPGGGIDYRLNRQWSVRADFEYQLWPQFTYGSMSSAGVTVGMRRRIF